MFVFTNCPFFADHFNLLGCPFLDLQETPIILVSTKGRNVVSCSIRK